MGAPAVPAAFKFLQAKATVSFDVVTALTLQNNPHKIGICGYCCCGLYEFKRSFPGTPSGVNCSIGKALLNGLGESGLSIKGGKNV